MVRKAVFLTIAVLSLALAQVDTAWVRRYNGPASNSDLAYAMAVDGSGNVYVAGQSIGSGTSSDYATIKYTSTGDTAWVRRYNGPDSSGDFAQAIAVDGSGNVYVTGCSYNFGTGYDYVTIKYTSTGDTAWVRSYNGPVSSVDSAVAIAVDASGNVYVTGSSIGSGGFSDYATIKYTSSGDTAWVRRHNGPSNAYDDASAITVDASGNVYVTGSDYGTGPWVDYATIKYTSTGDTSWIRRYNGPYGTVDRASAIAVDASGNVYVTGRSVGSGTGFDYATIKYTSSGDTAWVRRYNGPVNDSDYARAIAVDASGNVYVTGQSWGSGTSFDYATIKYTSSGDTAWVRRYDGPASVADCASAIAVDGLGNVYVTGYRGTTAFNSDYATIRYASSGDTIWLQRYNGLGNNVDHAYAMAVDGWGNVYVTGSSWGSGGNDYATIKYVTPDAGCSAIYGPTGSVVRGTVVTPQALVMNYGTIAASFPVKMTIGSAYAETVLVSNLAAGDTTTVTFPDWVANPAGNLAVRCSTRVRNDLNPANDRQLDSVQVTPAPYADVGCDMILAPVDTIRPSVVVTPACSVVNYGVVTLSYVVRMRIDGTYSETTSVTGHGPGGKVYVTFPTWTSLVGGSHTVVCSTECVGDSNLFNDARRGTFTVRDVPPWPDTWAAGEPMPMGGGRAIKDGGWLLAPPGITDVPRYIFAAKGNKTSEFYRYDVATGLWSLAASIPMGREAKLPGKGCRGVADSLGYVYMTKGNNTQGFWRYNSASDSWSQMADVPLGASNKKVKGGADLAFYEKDGERCIYLVKGQKTGELWRYKISGDSWSPLQAVPVDLPALKTDAGSWLELVEEAADGHPYLYLHKAKFHHLHRYDLVTDQWVAGRRTGMPLVGRSGRSKKSKDGGSAAFWNGDIYALKGGNTCEFWRYRPASDSWLELPTIPEIEPDGKKKRVKGGGDVVNVGGGGFFVTKGNKTNTCWRIVVAESKRDGVMAKVSPIADFRLSIAPNPLRAGVITLRMSSPVARWSSGQVKLSIIDVAGRRVLNQVLGVGCQASGVILDLRSLLAGVYLVKLSAGNLTTTQKLVLQR